MLKAKRDATMRVGLALRRIIAWYDKQDRKCDCGECLICEGRVRHEDDWVTPDGEFSLVVRLDGMEFPSSAWWKTCGLSAQDVLELSALCASVAPEDPACCRRCATAA